MMGIARWTMGSSGSSWDYYPHDSNGLAVQNALAEPCACPVFVPTQATVCSPLVDGGCNSGEPDPCASPYMNPQLAAWSISVCTPLFGIACDEPQRRDCRRCCHSAGGIMVDCYVLGGTVTCLCYKECTPAQFRACDRDCQGQSRGRATGCYIVGRCRNGRLENPKRTCICERLSAPPEPEPPRPKPLPSGHWI